MAGFEGLEPSFAAALQAMIAAAPGAVTITSGYRSPERQAQLWQEALVKYGSPEAARKWVAPPGKSNHNHGAAADLSYASPEVQAWVHANAPKFGLNFRMGHEPWHVEMAPNGQPIAVPNQPGANLPFSMGTPGDVLPMGGLAVPIMPAPANPMASVLTGYAPGAQQKRLGDLVMAVQAEQDRAMQRAKAPGILPIIDQLTG